MRTLRWWCGLLAMVLAPAAWAADCTVQPDSSCVPILLLPVCSVSVAPNPVLLGNAATATANCNNSPTAWFWERVGPDGTVTSSGSPTWAMTPPQAGVYQIRVRGQNTGTNGGLGAWSPYTALTVVPAAPTCTLTASSLTPAVGSSITLTATCSNSPTSYTWTNCSSASSTCGDSRAVAGAITYQVVASNAGGASPPATVTVTWQAAPPPTPPVCMLTTSDATPPVGSNITLTATCSNSPTSYVWTNCSSAGSTCGTTRAIPGVVVYRVVASNASGASAPAVVLVNWQAAGSAPICTLTASNSAPTVGSSILLTATCSGSPTAYVWTNCSSAGATCSTSSAVPGAVTYQVVATNANGNSVPATVTVNWQSGGGGGGAVPACSLTSSSMAPLVNTTITLTAICSNSPTSYTWTNCSSVSSTCNDTRSVPGAVTYQVVATNANGNSAPATVTVNWQSGGGGGQSCTLTAVPATQTVNGVVNLTAACTGTPTSYSWVNCSSGSTACADSRAVPGVVVYQVTANYGGGGTATAVASATWVAPPECTLSVDNGAPPVGTTITVTATCSNSPTSYTWTGCATHADNYCYDNQFAPGVVTYTLVAANAAGSGTPVSLTVTWLGGGGGGGGGGPTYFPCTVGSTIPFYQNCAAGFDSSRPYYLGAAFAAWENDVYCSGATTCEDPPGSGNYVPCAQLPDNNVALGWFALPSYGSCKADTNSLCTDGFTYVNLGGIGACQCFGIIVSGICVP